MRIMIAGREPLVVLDQDCQVVTNRIIQEVEKAGMRTLRSFDLEAVRASEKGYHCPVHGTRACSCHLVVLLIMLHEHGSLTIILEGSNQRTSVYLESGQAYSEERVDPALTVALVHAFHPKEGSNRIPF